MNNLRAFATTRAVASKNEKNVPQATPGLVDPEIFLPGEEHIMRLPSNLNAFQLAKYLDEEPLEILEIIKTQTTEIVTDEFQILS